jgi:hypothetical protein
LGRDFRIVFELGDLLEAMPELRLDAGLAGQQTEMGPIEPGNQ